MNKVCETGLPVYRPYPRRLESLIISRCHYKGNAFSSVILRPWVLVRQGFELTTSRSADRRSPKLLLPREMWKSSKGAGPMRTQSYLIFLSTLYILRSTVEHRASTMFLQSSQSWARSSNSFHFTLACGVSVFSKPSLVVFWPSSHSFLLWVPEDGLTGVNL